ncbi:peptidoglycan DD-metalloendopeptidase family protein [Deinococcus psychrotolerans]|uniref:peptidoglycan DD-metalloendopeptidase family protein n=1 Tax=Deinococcus psychrotolerans TaxID=2489213 RepID=UPI001F1536BA|nr:M23 family metallopeptidase [Deinococcus psychrotolerans]
MSRPRKKSHPVWGLVCASLLLCWSAQAAGTYTVQAGDNLTVIAKRTGLSVGQLRAANPQIRDLNAVQAGKSIRLPDAHKVATSHRVRSGETLSSVAARYRLSLSQLVRANAGLSASRPLRAGKVLYIPARRVVVAAAKARGSSSQAVIKTASLRPLAPASGSRSWNWPVQGWVSSGYGERNIDGDQEMHYGVDIVVPEGTLVRAARGGRVIESRADFARGWGWTIIVDHGDGWKTRYAHLSRNLARVGDSVVRGQVIGRSGDTGRSTGPHLHFGTYLWDVPKNPLSLL